MPKLLYMIMVFAVSSTINLAQVQSTDIYARSDDKIQANELTIVDGENETEVKDFPYSLKDLKEKNYTLVSGDKKYTLHIDNTDPKISANVKNNATYKKANIKVKVSGAETHQVRLNNKVQKGDEFEVTKNGTYTLKIMAEDKAGNADSEEIKFKIYNADPVINVSGLDKTVQNTDYNITVNVTSERPVNTVIKLDGETVTSPITVSEEGTHTLKVTAEDDLGNTSEYSKTFTLDKTAPVVTVEGIDKASFNTDVHYKVTGADSVKINGEDAESEATLTEDGRYTLVATATDTAGNVTTITKQFRIKKAAPEITIEGIDDTHFNRNVHYKVTTDDAELTVKINGESAAAEATLTEDGTYTLTAVAEDEAGNTATATKTFTIDKTRPEITITGPENNKYYNEDVIYTVSVTDSAPTTDIVTLDGETKPKTGIVTTEGSHILYVKATDECGNESTKTLNFVIDRTAPQLSYNDVSCTNNLTKVRANATDNNIQSVAITASFDDKTLNGSGVSSASLSQDASGSSENDKWVFSATAKDKAGNETTLTKNVYRDTTDPVITLTKVDKYVNKNVNMTASVKDANVGETVMTVERGSSKDTYKGTSSITETLTREGKYTVTVKSTDLAGNTSEKETSFTIDKTAPTVTLTAPKGHNKSASGVSAKSNEDGQVYLKVVVDGKTLHDGKGNSYTNLRRNGEYKVEAYAVDLAGNKSAVKTASFVIDNTAPKASLEGAKSGAYYNKPVTITAVVKERFYKNTKVQVTGSIERGGKISMPFKCTKETTKASRTFKTNGTYKIKMTATDEAGNSVTTKELTFTIDTTKPQITIDVPLNNKYDSVIAPKVTIKDDYFKSKSINLTNPVGKTYRDSFGKTGGTRVYTNFKKVKTNDGEYVLSVTATDMAGNTYTDEKKFIVNRFGSTFKTLAKPEGYGQFTNKDVIYQETNLSGIKSFKCTIVRDAEESKAQDVKVVSKEKRSTYTIPASNFDKEGVYSVRLETTDNAGNTSKYDGKYSFTIDKTPPVITYTGVESGKTYKEDYVRVYVDATDSLSKDVDIAVAVDGREANLEKDEKGSYATLGNGYNQTVTITASDKAGNEAAQTIDKVSVSTSKLAFFVTHKLLAVGIVVAIAVLAVIAVLLATRKSKEDEGDDLVL